MQTAQTFKIVTLKAKASHLPGLLQALGWAVNRGPLVRPLTRGQFIAIYGLPITLQEEGGWAVRAPWCGRLHACSAASNPSF